MWEAMEASGPKMGGGDKGEGRARGNEQTLVTFCWSLPSWQSKRPQENPSFWVCRQRGVCHPVQPSSLVRTHPLDPGPSARPLGLPLSPQHPLPCVTRCLVRFLVKTDSDRRIKSSLFSPQPSHFRSCLDRHKRPETEKPHGLFKQMLPSLHLIHTDCVVFFFAVLPPEQGPGLITKYTILF